MWHLHRHIDCDDVSDLSPWGISEWHWRNAVGPAPETFVLKKRALL